MTALLRHASRPERSAQPCTASSRMPHRHLRPQACGGPTLSAEKPLVEKRRAAARQTCGSILTERLGRPTDMPGRRCLCLRLRRRCAVMPSSAARAVPQASVARLLAAWRARLNGVRCKARAQRHVASKANRQPRLSSCFVRRTLQRHAGGVTFVCRPHYELECTASVRSTA